MKKVTVIVRIKGQSKGLSWDQDHIQSPLSLLGSQDRGLVAETSLALFYHIEAMTTQHSMAQARVYQANYSRVDHPLFCVRVAPSRNEQT